VFIVRTDVEESELFTGILSVLKVYRLRQDNLIYLRYIRDPRLRVVCSGCKQAYTVRKCGESIFDLTVFIVGGLHAAKKVTDCEN